MTGRTAECCIYAMNGLLIDWRGRVKCASYTCRPTLAASASRVSLKWRHTPGRPATVVQLVTTNDDTAERCESTDPSPPVPWTHFGVLRPINSQYCARVIGPLSTLYQSDTSADDRQQLHDLSIGRHQPRPQLRPLMNNRVD